MTEYPIQIPQQLGPILRGFRREQKLTQKAVGTRSALAQNAISQIESKPGPASLDRLSRVLAALNLELVVRSRNPVASKSKSAW
jgi:HTH-type transcriptional regulator/antitoxin HipB